VDELADACAFLLGMANPPDLINVGTGTDVTIKELTEIVAEVVGFKGRIAWDATKPDGTPRKLMDVSRLTALGWRRRSACARAWPRPTPASSPSRPPARCGAEAARQRR
jgi:GDP-L-fucose synthase